MTSPRLALVTGVTGYIGAELTPRLLADGWRVRVLTRDPRKLASQPWAGEVEVVVGDAGDLGVLDHATDGVDVAWFLVHSMNNNFEYSTQDLDIASKFGHACKDNGVDRIIYLGGLQPEGASSKHLESREEVGDALLASGVPVAALRAGMVVGEGSASYDLLRTASHLPIIVGPTWLSNHVQPIDVEDALHYLVRSADLPADVSRWFDIGGPEVLSYRELLQAYLRASGRRVKPVIGIPLLLPRTAALWAGILAPRPTALVSALIASLEFDMVCHEHDLDDLVGAPEGGASTFEESVERIRASR